ncbi:unnamed protein product [Strongylus vulgaris]|uniref:Uncharacterized protein n=1 Tax=Strongylus vulgaris TaxID=40348 RepID=A0A3P7J1D8_STRVU|nr:unnamed protein product [Strongylus vulgaris]
MSCLAITFDGPKIKNGRRLFESFVQANKYSFWNRELVQAAESLIFMGFMKPCTLFVSAPVTHLQALRTAWARRVLKPAEGYQITSLGTYFHIFILFFQLSKKFSWIKTC